MTRSKLLYRCWPDNFIIKITRARERFVVDGRTDQAGLPTTDRRVCITTTTQTDHAVPQSAGAGTWTPRAIILYYYCYTAWSGSRDETSENANYLFVQVCREILAKYYRCNNYNIAYYNRYTMIYTTK